MDLATSSNEGMPSTRTLLRTHSSMARLTEDMRACGLTYSASRMAGQRSRRASFWKMISSSRSRSRPASSTKVPSAVAGL